MKKIIIREETDPHGTTRASIVALRANGISDAEILNRAYTISRSYSRDNPKPVDRLAHLDCTNVPARITIDWSSAPQPAGESDAETIKTVGMVLLEMGAYDWHGEPDIYAIPSDSIPEGYALEDHEIDIITQMTTISDRSDPDCMTRASIIMLQNSGLSDADIISRAFQITSEIDSGGPMTIAKIGGDKPASVPSHMTIDWSSMSRSGQDDDLNLLRQVQKALKQMGEFDWSGET